MKHPCLAAAAVIAMIVAFLPTLHADDPPRLLEQEVELTTVKEQTTLVRTTGRLLSTVDLKLRNKGDFPLESPLHAVVGFTDVNGGNFNGLTMAGMLGGIGQPPYQTFYRDLSTSIGDGLALGAETTFTISFERPSTTSVSYKVRIHGITNRPPLASPGGPYAGQAGAAISFNGSDSSDPDGDALSFAWDFGDGTTGAGPEPGHAYQVPGIHTARLTVTDPRGGSATRDVEVIVSPSGDFALARTRTLDGNGHPLGGVVVSQTGPAGNSSLTSDPETGFLSLGGGAGEHTWSFSRDGYLTTHRKASLAAGSVRVVAFPWLAALNSQRTELSVLNPTTVASPSGEVSLVFPPGAFDQIQSVALTDLHGQNLPLPLPHGWSPLAAFHLDMPGESAGDIACTAKLCSPSPPPKRSLSSAATPQHSHGPPKGSSTATIPTPLPSPCASPGPMWWCFRMIRPPALRSLRCLAKRCPQAPPPLSRRTSRPWAWSTRPPTRPASILEKSPPRPPSISPMATRRCPAAHGSSGTSRKPTTCAMDKRSRRRITTPPSTPISIPATTPPPPPPRAFRCDRASCSALTNSTRPTSKSKSAP